ncbi:MAG: response regulator, partial [Candidatus Binataceae bacterium]
MVEFGPLASARVLVVEQQAVASHLSNILANSGFECETASSADAAMAALEARGADVILCAMHADAINGVDFLRLMRSRHAEIPLIMLAEDPGVPAAVAAMRQGAFDYLVKPIKEDALIAVAERAVEVGGLRRENQRLRQQLNVASSAAGVVAESDRSKQLLALIRRVAPARSTTLIEGESG